LRLSRVPVSIKTESKPPYRCYGPPETPPFG
jgi:hypothetical protein